MTPEEEAGFAEAAAEAVRGLSRQGRLAAQEDVLAVLEAAGPTDSSAGSSAGGQGAAGPAAFAENRDARLALLLPAVLDNHPDIASFEGLSGQRLYHAPELLSRTYARILDRKGSPLVLLAEEIRVNSRDYPRPVPVELFEAPPFDLTPEVIAEALRAMAASPDFQDITFTPTDTGAVYLFSTLHLERGYAAFLAQQAESLAQNP